MNYGENLQGVDSMLHKQRSLVTFMNCDCPKDLMDIRYPGGTDTDEASLPGIREVLQSFGLEVRQALNLLVLVTTTGSAQPIAAGIDYEDWPEVLEP